MLDFEVQRCTRHCAVSGKAFQPGDEYVSVLVPEDAGLCRLDYAVENFQGPPSEAIGVWRSRVPEITTKKPKLAPTEILLKMFVRLADHPEHLEIRYVMALWLVRRRILRMEESTHAVGQREVLVLYCPRDGSSHEVPVAEPAPQRAMEIQRYLAELLFADAT